MATLSRRGGAQRPKPVMNVTPLVDVVLVLLIIFMIVIPAMEEGLNLELPAVQTPDEASDHEGPEPILLAIDADGAVLLQGQRVPDGELETHLQAAHARAPRRKLVLRGDRGVAYGQIRALFARAQTVGFPGVSLRVNHQTADAGESD